MQAKILLAAMLLPFTLSCDSDKDKAKIAEIQKQADDKVAQIQKEAQDKVAAVEKQMAQLQSDLADAGAAVKAEADEEVAKAKADADKLAAEAADALAKARNAYKDTEKKQLAPVFKELEEIHAKEPSAPKLKPQIDQALKTIATKKDAVKKEIDAFDSATLETLKTVKAKADQGVAELKALVHTTRAKLPQ
jgi:colicin import membrane protein